MRMEILPQEVIDKDNLRTIKNDGWVCIHIKRGMYGLPEAGMLANKLLNKCLLKSEYYKTQFITRPYRNGWRPIMFSLVVDDFRVKRKGIQHAKYLK